MNIRITTLALSICALTATSMPLFAQRKVEPVNRNSQGVALKGYDVVAYFDPGKATKGSAQFSHPWNGAMWWFTSPANRDRFASAPEKFAPQFGGYCAWAVSNNYTADADPEAWKIVDGKLYVNYNRDVQKKWEKEVDQRIANASKNWPNLHK